MKHHFMEVSRFFCRERTLESSVSPRIPEIRMLSSFLTLQADLSHSLRSSDPKIDITLYSLQQSRVSRLSQQYSASASIQPCVPVYFQENNRENIIALIAIEKDPLKLLNI
ncbi:unnamed protein product [Allacma fusca]|uniref:Uncharacterized protein n=1 Tax=Allacma fusca TaxID=39272 RepID=A0A8J2LJB1_9HEXA|nr:unnamed protein product [Allacma fusca]